MRLEDFNCQNNWEINQCGLELVTQTTEFMINAVSKIMDSRFGKDNWDDPIADAVVSQAIMALYDADNAVQSF